MATKFTALPKCYHESYSSVRHGEDAETPSIFISAADRVRINFFYGNASLSTRLKADVARQFAAELLAAADSIELADSPDGLEVTERVAA